LTTTDLTTLTDKQLIRLANKVFKECDRMAREGGGCEFGWDWPTFSICFPEKYAEFQAIKQEGRRRGLHQKK
jgi:hypothetical protein